MWEAGREKQSSADSIKDVNYMIKMSIYNESVFM